MQITKTDKVNVDNLVRILKRAKLELEGAEEIFGTAEALRWAGNLAARIDKDLKDQEEAHKAALAALAARPVEELSPKTEIKPENKAKKSKK